MRIVLSEFHGLAPKRNRRRLPEGFAQVAENVKFDAGDLQPIRAPQTGQIIDGDIGNLHWYRFGDDEKLIAFGRNLETYGFRTPTPNDVHKRWYWNVRGSGLPEELGLFAIADPANPSPAFAASSVGSGANYRQFRGYNVGIPAPQKAPVIMDATAVEAVGHGTDVAVVSISRTNPATINLDGEHGFRSGQRVRIKIDPEFPRPDEDEDEDGDGVPPQIVFGVTNIATPSGNIVVSVEPSVVNVQGEHIRLASSDKDWPGHGIVREIINLGTNTITLSGPAPSGITTLSGAITATVVDEDGEVTTTEGQVWQLDGRTGIVSGVSPEQFDISGLSASGFQEFTANELAAIRIERDLVDGDFEARSYVFTYVSLFGEEGPPSEASNVLDIPKSGGTVRMELEDIDHIFSAHGGSRRNVNRIRVYRTVSGTSDTLFVFVGELGLDGTPGEGVDWEEVPGPSSDPQAGWTAVAVDSVDSVSRRRPLQTEGWYPPPKGLWGVHLMPNGFAVGWRENTLYFSEPYLPHAWDPDNTRTTDDDIVGVQSFGNTLVVGTRGRPYVATGVDPQSISLRKLDLHAPLLHRRAMVDAGSGVFYPSTNGLVWIGAGGSRYLTQQSYDKRTWETAVENRAQGVFHDQRALFFGPGINPLMADANGEHPEFSHVDLDIAAAVQAEHDLIVVTRAADNQYRQVLVFKEESPGMEGRWRSGLLTMPKPCNLAAAQVYADGYPLTFRVWHANVDAAGQPNLEEMTVSDYTVFGPEPFRLAAGYLSREFVLELVTEHRVQQVIASTSMAEIRALP